MILKAKSIICWGVLLCSLLFFGCGNTGGTEKKEVEYKPWPTSGLSQKVPAPTEGQFEILSDNDKSFSCNVHVSKADEICEKYISECKKMGYTVEADESKDRLKAFNSEGYGIRGT